MGLVGACVTDGEPLTGQAIYYAKDYMTDFKYRPYKAFAIHTGLQSGGLAWNRRSPDVAIDAALERCKSRSEGVPCELYAIGNTVVYGMTAKQIEEEKQRYLAANSILKTLGKGSVRSFERYIVSTKPEFKAFAIDPINGYSGWSYAFWDSKSAINRALLECKNRSGRDCKIYALGSRVVFDFNAEELEAAIREADKKSMVDPRK
tara:strand:+ start:786 stop:1400 length:615 start_codon:yes stop_codon:yes gene_type:complete